MFLIAKQDRYLRRFEQAKATDPAAASTLDALGLRDSHVFRGLTQRGLFATASAGTYYLVPTEVARFRKRRRQQATIILWSLAAVILAFFLLRE